MVVIFVDSDQHFFVSLDKFNLWVHNISKYILRSFLFYFLWNSGKEVNNQANLSLAIVIIFFTVTLSSWTHAQNSHLNLVPVIL